VRHFVQEFGLILFVFSIGLQVGPGFFSSFKHGGLTLVGCATAIVLLGVATAYVIHLVTGTPVPTMVGILSGAVTNTPGLGAAQQAYADAAGTNDPTIALGYAVAYPLGVVGIIFSISSSSTPSSARVVGIPRLAKKLRVSSMAESASAFTSPVGISPNTAWP